MLGVAGLHQRCRRIDAQPGEPCPVLIPAIGEQADERARLDVPDSGEAMEVPRALGLLVERRHDDGAQAAVDDGEADGNEPGRAVGRHRAEVGGGAILEAPRVGSPVRVVTLASLPYRNELTVTRRVLD